LTKAGYDVTVLGRSRATLDAVVSDGQARMAEVVDILDLDRLAGFVAQGRFDILVNNAGGAETAPFLKTGRDVFRRMIALNVESLMEATRAALPYMLDRKFGRVVNIASTAGLKGYGYVSAYVAAKHAVVGLTRALALEFVKTGVTVNAICPGYTDTDLVVGGVETIMAKTGKTAEQARAHFEASNPMGRLIRPEEVADAALWLAGPLSSAITGQSIVVAGGEL
jgi:NAD(P)-dependent dehydrogenase (short-subunit alcohol dehydrogenase family)